MALGDAAAVASVRTGRRRIHDCFTARRRISHRWRWFFRCRWRHRSLWDRWCQFFFPIVASRKLHARTCVYRGDVTLFRRTAHQWQHRARFPLAVGRSWSGATGCVSPAAEMRFHNQRQFPEIPHSFRRFLKEVFVNLFDRQSHILPACVYYFDIYLKRRHSQSHSIVMISARRTQFPGFSIYYVV